MIKRILLIPKFLYSLWAYGTAMLVLFFGAIGYALISIFHRGRAERAMLRVNNVITVIWGFLNGIRYRVKVPESMNWKQPAVYVINHTSTLDMFICSYAFRMGARFLAKKELLQVPFMGFMFSKISVMVDRSSDVSRKASLDAMKELAAKGISLVVFPEGTRNRGTEVLGKFYDGAFTMAIHAGLPIVPLVLTRGRQLMPTNSKMLRPGVLYAEYLPPVSTDLLTESDLNELKSKVFQLMYNKIVATDPDYIHLAPLENVNLV